MNSQQIRTETILSIVTGYTLTENRVTEDGLLNDEWWDDFYAAFEFICHEAPFTHQLPRFAEEARPYLIDQFTWMKGLDTSGITGETVQEWTRQLVSLHGEWLTVLPMPQDDHDFHPPELDALKLNPKMEIIYFENDEDDA